MFMGYSEKKLNEVAEEWSQYLSSDWDRELYPNQNDWFAYGYSLNDQLYELELAAAEMDRLELMYS